MAACPTPLRVFLPDRHRFKMVRIHARSISAKVIQNQSVRNGPLQQFVCHSMSLGTRSVRAIPTPIAVASNFTHPFPAVTGLIDLHPETIDRGGHSRSPTTR